MNCSKQFLSSAIFLIWIWQLIKKVPKTVYLKTSSSFSSHLSSFLVVLLLLFTAVEYFPVQDRPLTIFFFLFNKKTRITRHHQHSLTSQHHWSWCYSEALFQALFQSTLIHHILKWPEQSTNCFLIGMPLSIKISH